MGDIATKSRIIASWIIGLLLIGAAIFNYFHLSAFERLILFLIGIMIVLIF